MATILYAAIFTPTMPKVNVLVTGNRYTGKSTICVKLAERLNLKWIDFYHDSKNANLVKWSKDTGRLEIDETRALFELRKKLPSRGYIVEYQNSTIFNSTDFDIIFYVKVDHVQYDKRLRSLGVPELTSLTLMTNEDILYGPENCLKVYFPNTPSFIVHNTFKQHFEYNINTISNILKKNFKLQPIYKIC